MTIPTRIRRLLVESPNSLGGRARTRRWAEVANRFPDFESYRVLDLGGTVDVWESAPIKPAHVTVLNIADAGTTDVSWLTSVKGDACDAASELVKATGKGSFDLVFSNAVLEHVGGHANRARFASQVRALAPRHWVQTPYRYFPIEPHWLFPGMQFLPVAVRARIAATWPLAHAPARSYREGRSSVLWTELIGIAELREYFPDSKVVHERVGGLTKSIIAVKE